MNYTPNTSLATPRTFFFMISSLKILTSAAVISLLVGAANAGPIAFSGNSSISSSDLKAITVKLGPGEGGLVPDPAGSSYRLGQLDAQSLAPAAISAVLRGISELYQERGILATRAVVTAPGYQASLRGEPLQVKIVE